MFVADLDLDVERKTLAIEARMAELMGVINAAHGELVQITAAVLDENLGVGGGVHTPTQYLGWQAGISPGRARDMVRIASRHDDLPATVAALCAGKLTIDQAAQIAHYVPAHYEADAADVGAMMTVRQMQRTYRRYSYDPDAPPEPEGDQTKPDADEPAANDEPAPPVRPPTVEEESSVSFGTDEKGWAANIHLPMDQGAVVERGLRATYEDLVREANLGLAAGEKTEQVTYADALIAMAEAALHAGEARYPGTDRYLVHTHLEASPDQADDRLALSLHLGARLPKAIADLLLCDPTARIVIENHGTPINVGRTTRVIRRRIRRLVEQRDGGGAVPGCGRIHFLEIHHIRHWEDGGPTDTNNLVTLCRRHHRMHHTGTLGITGNPDLPSTDPDHLRFTNRWNKPIQPVGTPKQPAHHDQPVAAAEDIGVAGTFTAPTGERICGWGFHINPAPPAPRHPNPWIGPPPGEPEDSAPGDPPAADGSGGVDRPANQGPPGGTTDTSTCTDPSRAGPDVA